MLVLTIGLMAVVKLDRVVNSTGRIEPSAGSLYLSPYDTGIIRQIDVKVGEVVKKGQPLATLDPTFTHADLVQLQQHLASDAAAVAREQAELSGQPYVFSSTDPYQATQGGIWMKRQAQYRADLASFDAQIHSAESQMAQAASDVERYEKRVKLAGDTENVYQPLLEKGYVSKLQVMQAADTRTEMSRLLADAQNQVAQYRETATSLKAQRDSYIQKWHSDTANQLVLDRNDLDLTRDSLEKAQKMQDLTTLDAPTDAIVLKIGKVSTGSVTSGAAGAVAAQSTQGDPLFTLVPLDSPVEADVMVSSQDIAFIRVGDPVTIKLDAYMYLRHGTAKGVVKTISEGSFTLDDNGQPVPPFFRVRVTIKEVKLHNVPKDFRLVPGMTVAGDIMVDKRTILSYLLEGALRTGSEAMREPQ
jgi:HlyD family type I secretion membrane fusion protein